MSDENAKRGRAYEFVIGQSRAILEESLDTIAAIAQRTNEDPEAVAAKLGSGAALLATTWTGLDHLSAALLTELDLWEILVLAPRTLHSASL